MSLSITESCELQLSPAAAGSCRERSRLRGPAAREGEVRTNKGRRLVALLSCTGRQTPQSGGVACCPISSGAERIRLTEPTIAVTGYCTGTYSSVAPTPRLLSSSCQGRANRRSSSCVGLRMNAPLDRVSRAAEQAVQYCRRPLSHAYIILLLKDSSRHSSHTGT